MKLGIVGNGMIVKGALSSLSCTDIEVRALWCRNEEKGKPLQEEYGFEKLYSDYDAFLADESFDTVYIGLPNGLHYEYAKKALEAGKHVIVEKPFTGCYAEASELFGIAEEKGLFLFEAIMSRYSKNYEEIVKHLDEIGDLKLIRCNYSQYSSRYDAYLEGKVLPAFDPEAAGGALYDINVYNVHFVTGLFGKPKFSYYMANTGFNGIDTSGILLMDYGMFKAVCVGAKDSASESGIVLQGTKGRIEIPNRPGIVKDVTVVKDDGNTVIDVQVMDDPMRIEFERINDVIDRGDCAAARLWMNSTLNAMYVLEEARADIGLVFPCDEVEEEEALSLDMASMLKMMNHK